MSPVRRPHVAGAGVAVVTCLATCLVTGLVLGGCSGPTDSGPRPTAAPRESADEVISLEDVDTTALVVSRGPFCGRVEPAAVARALGRQVADASAYRSGQRIRISDDVADVVHEFGCRWTAGDDTAQAWVFAPPMTRERAVALLRELRGSRECAGLADQPEFGRPSGACLSSTRRGQSVTFNGLFGDAWLSCSLRLSDQAEAVLTDRAQSWCAAVATGAAGEPS